MTSMTTNTPKECSEFQEQLPDFFDSGGDRIEHPHLNTCANCSALVRDLNYIAAQAKLLMPIHDPSPAVWENISHALAKKPTAGRASEDDGAS
ncbi:MAG TPA: hypothetical protein VFN53_01385 [Acidobacteriaceae bacterium]|nr:hypothetical protein [Acidobacteriaceae bacterium]